VRSRASHIVNFGFLLGLVVVTSVTQPDYQKEARSSETVMKPIETTDHVNMDAKLPVMPQLALVAIPQPPTHIQVEASKQETPSQPVKAPAQSKAPSKAKPAPLVPKTEMKKRTITPMTPQRRELAPVKHRPDVIPLSQPEDLKSATQVAHITPLKPKTKPLVAANMAASNLTKEAVTEEVSQASLNSLSLERLAKTTERPTMSPPLDMLIEVARPTIADLAIARQQLNKGEEAPSIEFLWPSDRNDHRQIYHSLTNCLGMTVGHVNAGGKVTLADGQNARNYNRQIFSPMLRSLNEPSTPAEANLIKAVSNQTGAGQLVRIFRKETDAKILAGLRNLTGVSGPVTGSLSAEYLLTSRGLYLADIIHNGKAISGRIELLKGRCR
jgi:hypothetical protein